MVNLKYVSSIGIEYDLHSFEEAKLKDADFHNVSWEPEVINKQFGTVINRFKKPPQIFDVTFRFKGDPAKRKEQIDKLIFMTEVDIATKTPGRIYWNEQYIEVYFNTHDCYAVNSGMAYTDLKGKFYAPFPFWIQEASYHIDPTNPLYPSGGLPRDVKGYPVDRLWRYAYTYSYPLGGNSGIYYVDSPIGADFTVTIYGPINYAKMVIAGNNYEVDYPLRRGEKLIIDSRDTLPLDKKCYVVRENGDELNVFDYRDPSSSLFKRLPGGPVVVSCNQPYIMDITLYLERSAPV